MIGFDPLYLVFAAPERRVPHLYHQRRVYLARAGLLGRRDE